MIKSTAYADHPWMRLALTVVLLAGCTAAVPAAPSTSSAPVAQATPPASPAPSASTSPAAAPTKPPPSATASALADCSTLSIEDVKHALGQVDSYAYEGEGYRDRYEDIYEKRIDPDPLATPSILVREPVLFHGAYQAPDRATHELESPIIRAVLEARRQIGDQTWIRYVGSTRWQVYDRPSDGANLLLAMIGNPAVAWSGPQTAPELGNCRFTGTSKVNDVDRQLTLVVDRWSAFPLRLEENTLHPTNRDWGAFVKTSETLHVLSDSDLSIEPPELDTGPATWDEATYWMSRASCRFPPCPVIDLRVTYEIHVAPVDLFGYEGADGHGYIAFVNGSRQSGGFGFRACATPDFDAYELGSSDSEGTQERWIGGPLALTESATMRIEFQDGTHAEHAVTGPAYVVPAGSFGGPALERVTVHAVDGTERFAYVFSTPHPTPPAPPPPPPSPEVC